MWAASNACDATALQSAGPDSPPDPARCPVLPTPPAPGSGARLGSVERPPHAAAKASVRTAMLATPNALPPRKRSLLPSAPIHQPQGTTAKVTVSPSSGRTGTGGGGRRRRRLDLGRVR